MWRRFRPKHKVNLRRQYDTSHIHSISEASREVERLKTGSYSHDSETLHRMLIMQTPRAALAQAEMDKHRYGYKDREQRLFELIDFNDTFVSKVLALPDGQEVGFTHYIYQEMRDFCRRLKTPNFSEQQFEAIVNGLGREIAVYRGARACGFKAEMTSRVDDAFGIDMRLTRPDTNNQLNIDCKAPSAYRHRLEDLVKSGRISEVELIEADKRDHITLLYRRDDQDIPVTLFCVRPETVGEVVDFAFEDLAPLRRQLNEMFNHICMVQGYCWQN